MNWRHGGCLKDKRSPEFNIWATMKARCTNPNNDRFKNYGKRGIVFCSRWEKYENFIADMGKRPYPKLSLERRNNNGNYEPDNCYWGTRKEQANNTTTNVLIEYKNETNTLKQWAEKLSINYKTFWTLVQVKKLTIDQILELPLTRSIFITYNGETLNVSNWIKRLKISRPTFYKAIRNGLSKEQAVGKFYKKVA